MRPETDPEILANPAWCDDLAGRLNEGLFADGHAQAMARMLRLMLNLELDDIPNWPRAWYHNGGLTVEFWRKGAGFRLTAPLGSPTFRMQWMRDGEAGNPVPVPRKDAPEAARGYLARLFKGQVYDLCDAEALADDPD